MLPFNISAYTHEGIVLFSSNHAKSFTITGQRGLLLWGSKRGGEGEEQKRDSKSCRWDDFGFDDCDDDDGGDEDDGDGNDDGVDYNDLSGALGGKGGGRNATP